MQTLMEHNLFWRLLRSSADRDVISWGFCLDGFTLLSVAVGACLTQALTHCLHPNSAQAHGCRSQRSKEHGGFCHTVSLSSLQLTFCVFFLYICFSSGRCVHLIFRRPWQDQVAIQILQVVCSSIDYQVIIDFMWRQLLKKSFKTNSRWSVSKVKLLKWPSGKLTDALYAVCVRGRIDTESTPKPINLYTIFQYLRY